MKANKIYYHIIEEVENGEVGYQGYCETEDKANDTIKDLSDKFEYSYFWIYTSNTSNEPPIITI